LPAAPFAIKISLTTTDRYRLMNRSNHPRRWQIAVFPAVGFGLGSGILAVVAALVVRADLDLSRLALAGLLLAALIFIAALAGGGYYVAVRNNRPDREPLSDAQMRDVIDLLARASVERDGFKQN
jgi:hypothetical protein